MRETYYADDEPAAPRRAGDPTPIREILAEILDDLALRMERRPGVAHLVLLALGMRRAGAGGFAGVAPIQLLAEMSELLGDEESAP